jgi:hypothetical protein
MSNQYFILSNIPFFLEILLLINQLLHYFTICNMFRPDGRCTTLNSLFVDNNLKTHFISSFWQISKFIWIQLPTKALNHLHTRHVSASVMTDAKTCRVCKWLSALVGNYAYSKNWRYEQCKTSKFIFCAQYVLIFLLYVIPLQNFGFI